MTPHGSGSDQPAVYVALGDSISIDEYAGGTGRGGASLLARNRDDDFPEWRGSDLHSRFRDLRWQLLATDGGTTATLLGYQLPLLQQLPLRPSIITLTVGGNDVLSCYGDTRAALQTIGTVRQRVGAALTSLPTLTQPSAQVVVGTVYDPSDGTGDTATVGLPPWPDVVAVLAELNSALRTVAAEHGAVIADIHGRFLGHGLSRGNPAQGNPWPVDRGLWYCNIIEPNAWGADGVRAAFWSALSQARM